MKQMDLKNAKVILVVLDRNTKHIYKTIKRFIYCELGIPVQVVLKENSSKNLSYYGNVLNQIIAKMGGQLYNVPLDKGFSMKPAMIIGYDVVKFGKGRKYVMTASYDQHFSKFYTEEIIVEQDSQVGPVGSLMKKCLDYFFRFYKGVVLPANIIIYRSGVSEYEKKQLLNHEVKTLVNTLSGELHKECYKEKYKANFCYLLVNKKIDAKFFEYSNNNTNNPREGTIIDNQVTTPGAYEFYLQPQFVNSGTATATHFECLFDNTGIPLEILEETTYRLCYYYWNWTGAIREPAALKFAGVANKFSTTHMNNYVKNNLKDSPYYI